MLLVRLPLLPAAATSLVGCCRALTSGVDLCLCTGDDDVDELFPLVQFTTTMILLGDDLLFSYGERDCLAGTLTALTT